MTINRRIGAALAALLLLPLYWIPFWSISLEAPQFPEGIGMHIAINDVTGHSKHDISSINILNHYIGMQTIDVDAIPEIKIMPWIFAVLIAGALLAGATGYRTLVLVWLGAFVVLVIAGFVDYYLWGYEYGHNLSPDAPIKVPGMSYQPPLIGTKQLLNITAGSWPYWGALFMLASFSLMAWVAKPTREAS